jgi:uncharacterized protein (DUF2147 family)
LRNKGDHMAKNHKSCIVANGRLIVMIASSICLITAADAQTRTPNAPPAAGAPAPSQAPSPLPNPAPSAAPPVAGVWLDDKGEGAIEIVPCADKLCGRIVWLKSPNDKAGRPLTDGYNPETAKRKRPICGLPVIGDLKRMPSGAWDAGWIYDPKEGKSYDVEVKLRSADKLQVTGYLGTKFFSETFVWTRAPATLPKCASTSAASTY